jgi:hypothetical protein
VIPPTVFANNKRALIDMTGTISGHIAFYRIIDGKDSLDADSGQDMLMKLCLHCKMPVCH